MKYYLSLFSFLILFSCIEVGKEISLNELTIAPVLAEEDADALFERLDLLKEIGFNTILFIGAAPAEWEDLTVQAQGRGLYAVFMVDGGDAALIKDYILENGVKAKVDGIWLRQGEEFDRKELNMLKKAVQTMKKEITDRHVLGQIFVQSSSADMMALLRGGKLTEGIAYFDHSAAGLLGLASQMGTEEKPVSGIGADIAKMYNWRNFYTKNSDLIVPLANNFSYAFAQEKIFPLISAVMTSVSGPLYMPVALTPADRVFYTQDISLIKQYLALRKAHPSLYAGKQTNLAYSSGVYVDVKETGSERIILVCNFNGQALRYRLPYLDKFNLKGKKIRSLFNERSQTLNNNELIFDLAPYGVDFWLIE